MEASTTDRTVPKSHNASSAGPKRALRRVKDEVSSRVKEVRLRSDSRLAVLHRRRFLSAIPTNLSLEYLVPIDELGKILGFLRLADESMLEKFFGSRALPRKRAQGSARDIGLLREDFLTHCLWITLQTERDEFSERL